MNERTALLGFAFLSHPAEAALTGVCGADWTPIFADRISCIASSTGSPRKLSSAALLPASGGALSEMRIFPCAALIALRKFMRFHSSHGGLQMAKNLKEIVALLEQAESKLAAEVQDPKHRKDMAYAMLDVQAARVRLCDITRSRRAKTA
jgi:hypothetical protein